jgi:hypothetical protein
MNKSDFWKPQPREPWQDWRTYSLIVPLILSSIAFGIFSVFTYALDDIDEIASLNQSRLVVIAAFCAAIGAEVGTPFTIIEIFRKVRIGRAERQDWFALGASLAATLVVVTIGMASRITHSMETPPTWASAATEWGPVLVGVVVVLDGYGGMIETGDLFGTFEQRMEAWLLELEAHEQREEGNDENMPELVLSLKETLEKMVLRVDSLQHEVDEVKRPIAKKADFDRVVKRMNGGGKDLTEDRLSLELAADGLRMPSPSTSGRWLKGMN